MTAVRDQLANQVEGRTVTTGVGPATIRHATRDDCAAIERLLTEAGLPTAGVAEILEDRAQDFFVAESSAAPGRVVAVAGLDVCCNDALLRSVAVQSEWRDHGVGRDLIRRVVCHAEERGIRAVYLLTMTAEHYFPRFGFEPVDRFAVPREIAETLEFKSACPATAVAMRRAATSAAK